MHPHSRFLKVPAQLLNSFVSHFIFYMFQFRFGLVGKVNHVFRKSYGTKSLPWQVRW